MWKASYYVQIEKPSTHYVSVKMELTASNMPPKVAVFLPSWSPGSYLLREYAKHLRCFRATNQTGEELCVEAKTKSSWEINLKESKTKTKSDKIILEYQVYCHEVSVRTSYIDVTHAFLHGPTYLMGVQDDPLKNPCIEFKIPEIWSKISTGLLPVEGLAREVFKYQAEDYDELLDCPVELGCHETDGFKISNTTYELAFYGNILAHQNNLKADIKKITETINNYMGDVPFSHYLYLTHFLANSYGGLEHSNSTVLMYDGRKLGIRKDYISFLSLVAHEYFHAWNVKRIRPIELGPFDYQNENYTTMLWLAEGLTKFMDDYFVLKANLMTQVEYLDFLKSDLNNYFKTPGRKYDSLESSSFGAWIKLYRPHENSANSSISYYLKGGLVFLSLHLELRKNNLSIKNVIQELWQMYKINPEKGLSKNDFYTILKKIGTTEDLIDLFDDYLTTTKEINFIKHFENSGIEIEWEKPKLDFGMELEFSGERIIIKSILEDGAAFQAGFNAQDEIIAVEGNRILKADWEWFTQQLMDNKYYQFLICRLGVVTQVEVMPKNSIQKVTGLKIKDTEKFKAVFEL
jgi:predicted metalloprotease with PDZ domain